MLWVVMRARVAGSNAIVWAWCLLGDGPGFDSEFFTEADGVSQVDVEGEVELLDCVFTARARNPAK